MPNCFSAAPPLADGILLAKMQNLIAPTSQQSPERSDERFRLLVEGVTDYAIFMLDPGGVIMTWNAGAERIKGYSSAEIIGQHFRRFYTSEALLRGLPERELAVASAEGRFEEEGWRLRKDGSTFWANVVLTALRNETGELRGFAKVTRDLTRRRQHEESLRQSEERFRLLVDGVRDHAIFMLDANGYIKTWNTGAERIKGYTADEIVGQHFSKFYPLDVAESGWPAHELKQATETGRYVEEGWRIRKDGSQFWANVTITALRDDEGRLRGFAKLTQDLSERRAAEFLVAERTAREALLESERKARIAAQQATIVKDEFLAALSHELRTPLTAILGWTQVLRHQSSDPIILERALEIIERNTRAQAQLIDDLLDLSRVTSGRIHLDVQKIWLLDIVQGAIDSAEPSAKTKGVSIEAILEPVGPGISGDATRLQQVCGNLLSNAIKFTPAGGTVQIRLQRNDSHVEITVNDTGIGIPAAFLPFVFDRFSQRDSSIARRAGGLGLGLAISKELVELHGGTLTAQSPGEGRGATFVVQLPVGVRDSRLPAVDQRRLNASAENQPTTRSLFGLHVLIVDDEPDVLLLVQRILEEQGAHVTCAASGREALGILAMATPDVLLSDIGMPEIDGYQLMRQIRSEEPKGQRLPALALTAYARPEDRKNALLAGYQSYLAKPVDMRELIDAVAGLVRSK